MDTLIHKLDTTEKRIRVGREVWKKYPEWTMKENVNEKYTNEPKEHIRKKRHLESPTNL